MNDVNSIAFALDPTNVPAFLLDWEITKKCNLDCSYCGDIKAWGMFAGHDNGTNHPPLNECLDSIDFMYKYVDLYMKHKKPSQRKVVLNVYGGESLFHPDIIEILHACRDKYSAYQNQWHLTITCTTNAIVGEHQWGRTIDLVDEFTVSYHAQSLPKQKLQFRNNLLKLKDQNKRFKCIIMMHPHMWDDCLDMVKFCESNDIRYLKKPLDNNEDKWAYTSDQIQLLRPAQKIEFVDRKVISIAEGRQCCGGRSLSLNGDLKSKEQFVTKQGFRDWYCSVNWFFLFVQQLTGDIYTNKDCRTSTTNRIEPLGNLKESSMVLDNLQTHLSTGTMPIIKCSKDICRCGFCAPKAESKEDFMELIRRNASVDVFQK